MMNPANRLYLTVNRRQVLALPVVRFESKYLCLEKKADPLDLNTNQRTFDGTNISVSCL
jgi:hypothetical protein